MRPGQRLNLKSAIAVFAVSLLGLLLVSPLAWNDSSLSNRARYVVVGPGVLLCLANSIYLDAVRRDAPCYLFFAIACGFLVWPLTIVPLAGVSVAAIWTLACRYPELVEQDIENFSNMLNTATCDSAVEPGKFLEVGTWTEDWQLWAAWLGALLVFSMATALLASAIPSRKEIHGNERQNEFREKIAARRKEEADGRLGVDIGSGASAIELGARQPIPTTPSNASFRHGNRPSPSESPAEANARYQQQVEATMRAAQAQAAATRNSVAEAAAANAAGASARPQSSRPMPTSMGGSGPDMPRVQSLPLAGLRGVPSDVTSAQAQEMERLRLQLANAQADRDAAYSLRGGGIEAFVEEEEAAAAAEAERRGSVAARMARLSVAGQHGQSAHHMTVKPAAVQIRVGGSSYASQAPPPPSAHSSLRVERTTPPPAGGQQRRASATTVHRFD